MNTSSRASAATAPFDALAVAPVYRVEDLTKVYRMGEVEVHALRGIDLEAGSVWMERDDVSTRDLTYSVTLAIALDTRAGPVYLAYGYADRGTGYFQLSVGPRF